MSVELTLANGTVRQIGAGEPLRPLLETVNDDDNTFAILARGDEDFIQTAREAGRFIVETRRGSDSEHYAAVRAGSALASIPRDSWWSSRGRTEDEHLDLEEVVSLFDAWIANGDPPPSMKWVRMHV